MVIPAAWLIYHHLRLQISISLYTGRWRTIKRIMRLRYHHLLVFQWIYILHLFSIKKFIKVLIISKPTPHIWIRKISYLFVWKLGSLRLLLREQQLAHNWDGNAWLRFFIDKVFTFAHCQHKLSITKQRINSLRPIFFFPAGVLHRFHHFLNLRCSPMLNLLIRLTIAIKIHSI